MSPEEIRERWVLSMRRRYGDRFGTPEWEAERARKALEREAARLKQQERSLRIAASRSAFDRRKYALLRGLMESGVDYCCTVCGIRTGLTLDHIVPLKLGGDNSVQNMQLLCRFHNSSKGGRA